MVNLAGRKCSLHSLRVDITPGILIYYSQTALLICLLNELPFIEYPALCSQVKRKVNSYISKAILIFSSKNLLGSCTA